MLSSAVTATDPREFIDEEANQLAMRRWAASIGGFLIGFVLGDAGLASNSVGVVALAVGAALFAFALVR